MRSNVYLYDGTTQLASVERNFNQDGETVRTRTDGMYSLRAQSFNIVNLDTTFALRFSFDNTNFASLYPGESWAQGVYIDRYWVKSDETSYNVPFKISAELVSYKGNIK